MKLISNREGRIFLFGIGLGFMYIICLGIICIFLPELIHVFIGMTATNIIFGRAAGMSLGYTMGLDHNLVVSTAMLVETILVLIFYPLFVLTWEHLILIEKLQKIMANMTTIAEVNRSKVKRYGLIGLLIFVWFPFWMTGPLAGSVIGFFIGLQPFVNISVVLIGTFFAIICWSLILKNLHEQVAMYSPYAPVIVLLVIIVIAIIGHLMYKKHCKK